MLVLRRIGVFPNGYQLEGHERHYNIIGLALRLESLSLHPGTKLLVHFKFRIRDQKNGNHFERSGEIVVGFPLFVIFITIQAFISLALPTLIRFLLSYANVTKRNLKIITLNCCHPDSKVFGSNSLRRGIIDFMSLTKFKAPENGFLVNDTCIIEAEAEVLGLVTLD